MKMREVRRLPLGFGPVQVPEVTQMAEVTSIQVSYETDADTLKTLLPEDVTLDTPTVHVIFNKYNGCNLLAGRGYNSIIIGVDAARKGKKGMFVPVRFVTDMFAMIDGRYGDFGFPDLYSDILDPLVKEYGYYIYATEYHHKYMEMKTSKFEPASAAELAAFQKQMHKQNWILENKDVTIVTRVDSLAYGEGSAVFFESSWFDTPDICQIANFMKKLPVTAVKKAIKWTGAMEIGEGGEL